MKIELITLSRHYASALRKHLRQGPHASLEGARRLGRQAVSLGLETLDVARIHEEVLATLEGSSSTDGIIERSEIFFTEAIIPIEKTHHAALKANVRLNQVSRTLSRRTVDLAITNKSLKRGIARRKTAESALRKSEGHAKRLLEESRRMQKHLQHLTRKILSTQEADRKKLSRNLQDEIIQTLVGINVRVVTLKQESAAKTKGLQEEIASTERLVEDSMKSIEWFARELALRESR